MSPMALKLAQSQLADLPERVGVVEAKVEHLNEKVDEIKIDIKEMHDCLDNTRDSIMTELKLMNQSSSAQHDQLAGKINELEKVRNKGMVYGMALLAFLAGSGAAGHLNLGAILKFVGI